VGHVGQLGQERVDRFARRRPGCRSRRPRPPRPRTPANVVFFDEVLDGLDADGTRRVCEWLEGLPFASIFLVSHNSGVADAFDHEIARVHTHFPGQNDPAGRKQFCKFTAPVYDEAKAFGVSDKSCSFNGDALTEATCLVSLDLATKGLDESLDLE